MRAVKMTENCKCNHTVANTIETGDVECDGCGKLKVTLSHIRIQVFGQLDEDEQVDGCFEVIMTDTHLYRSVKCMTDLHIGERLIDSFVWTTSFFIYGYYNNGDVELIDHDNRFYTAPPNTGIARLLEMRIARVIINHGVK
jgi:hypothetical protein